MTKAALNDIRRRIIHQFLDVIILEKLSLLARPISKQGLMDYIYDFSSVCVEDGFILTALLLMERTGLIKRQSRIIHGYVKPFYEITDAGKRLVQSYETSYNEVLLFVKLIFKKSELTVQ